MEFFFQWFHSTKLPEKVANAPNGNRKHEGNEAKIFLIDMNDIWTLWELISAIPSYTHTHIHTSSTGPERFAQRRYKKTTRTFSRLIATPHNFHIGNSLARKHINTLVMIPLKYPRLNYADGDSVPVTISCTQPVLFFFCSSRIIRFFPGPADKASFRNAQEYNESRSSV